MQHSAAGGQPLAIAQRHQSCCCCTGRIWRDFRMTESSGWMYRNRSLVNSVNHTQSLAHPPTAASCHASLHLQSKSSRGIHAGLSYHFLSGVYSTEFNNKFHQNILSVVLYLRCFAFVSRRLKRIESAGWLLIESGDWRQHCAQGIHSPFVMDDASSDN